MVVVVAVPHVDIDVNVNDDAVHDVVHVAAAGEEAESSTWPRSV